MDVPVTSETTPTTPEPRDPATDAAPATPQDPATDPALAAPPVLEVPDLEGLEFLLDEIEDQIAPLA